VVLIAELYLVRTMILFNIYVLKFFIFHNLFLLRKELPLNITVTFFY